MKQTSLAVAIGLALSVPLHLQANPSGPNVVHGTATFSNPSANVLNVTNSNNAIINWQSFNIGQGQTTNFIQPSSSSSVLNKVIGNNPSQILGNLNSNGKVFLINQHGILVGQGAQINTAGFFGSTLNLTNEDYLNGDLKFEGGGLGGIDNQGYIHAGDNGHIVLIAPDIENGGVIEVDNGNVILAAGKSITITSLENSSIQFEVTGSEDTVTNLGQIIANNGAASLFAGTLKHSGAIRATGLVQDADGTIRLVATDTNSVSGTLDVSGENGGHIEVLGDVVTLESGAYVDASGDDAAGEILIGGDQQGLNPDVMNATSTTVAEGAEVHADGNEEGDGGRVIVFAENDVHVHGEITAKGGEEAGDGGFVETSGLRILDITSIPDASAPHGLAGEWLIDPFDIIIQDGLDAQGAPQDPENQVWNDPDFTSSVDLAVLHTETIEAALNAGTSVTVSTSPGGTGDGDISIFGSIQKDAGGDASLTLNAHNDIIVSTQSTSAVSVDSTSGVMDVVFNADSDTDGTGSILFDTGSSGNFFQVTVDTNGGQFSTNTDVTIIGGGSNVTINADWVIPQLTTLTVDQNLIINSPGTVVQNYGEIVVGSTQSNSSILNLTGDTLDLLPGAILSGFGSVVGNLEVNGGAVTGGSGLGLGISDFPGTLNVLGNFTMNSGLFYSVVTTGDGVLGSGIQVDGGIAQINGGSAMIAWGNSGSLTDAIVNWSSDSVALVTCISVGCVDDSSAGFDTLIGPLTSISSSNGQTITTNSVTFNYGLDTSANVVTWTGDGGDGVWSNASNWSTGEIPTATNNDFVFIHDAAGSQQIVLDALETAAGVQSFENIQLVTGSSDGILRVNGDIFILDDAGSTDGLLSLASSSSALEGTGVLYTGPGAGVVLSGGSVSKDIVNWGGVVTTAGSSFNLVSNPVGMVNNAIFLVGEGIGGSSSVTGTGSIANNAVLLFGNGGSLNLLENVSLSSSSTNATFQGMGDLSFQGSSVFNVAATPAVYDTSITIELDGGSISNAQNIAVMPDLFQWNSGAISGTAGTLNIAAGQVVNLFGLGDMSLSGGIGLSNQGTISFLSSSGDFYLDGSIQNNGQFLFNHTTDAADLLTPGSATLNNGTSGSMSFDSSNDLDIAWGINSSGGFTLNNGIVRLAGNLEVTDSLVDITNSAELIVASGGQLHMNSSTSDFDGDGTGVLTADSGGLIDLDLSLGKDLSVLSALQLNGGVINNIQGAVLPSTVSFLATSTLSGDGALTIPAATTVTVQGGGAFSGQGGSNLLTVTNQGVIDVQAGQTLTLSYAELINGSTGSITGDGQLSIPTFSILTASSGVEIAELSLVGGTLNANSLTYDGLLTWLYGIVADTTTGSGLTTTGSVNLGSGVLDTDWTISSTGNARWSGSELEELMISNATITNQGTFTIESFLYVEQLTTVAGKDFLSSTGASFINASGAELVIDANDDVVDFSNLNFDNQGGVIGIESGTFTLGSGNDLVLDQGGSLQGFGTFDGNVDNQNGRVSPGATGVSIPDQVGTLTITGNLQQGIDSTLEINLDGTGSDSLNVQGTLEADGGVRFETINGASSADLAGVVDADYNPISYGGFSGRFETVAFQPGIDFGFVYSPDGTISIGGALPTDPVSQAIEALLENNNLDYSDFVEVMSNLGGDVFEVLFANEIGEDEDEKAPRLVCK